MIFFRNIITPLLLTFVAFTGSHAQEWEIGGWGGIANYRGDLNTNSSFEFMGPAAGVFTRYNLGYRFANKIGINYGRVAFDDATSPYVYQQARNLSFRTGILQLTDQFEFHFFKYDPRKEEYSFTPYILMGISVFYFDPHTEYNGQPVALRRHRTEGRSYAPISLAIPIGGGFKYAINPFWAIGAEVSLHKTFTDYLDDVSGVYPGASGSGETSDVSSELSDRSGEVTEPIGQAGKQRGNIKDKDDFLLMGITLSYTLLKVRCPKPAKFAL